MQALQALHVQAAKGPQAGQEEQQVRLAEETN
jgi:hypothetical protein